MGGPDALPDCIRLSPGANQTILREVVVSQSETELVSLEEERRFLAGLVIDHVKLTGPPILTEVLFVAIIGQCLQQSASTIVEV